MTSEIEIKGDDFNTTCLFISFFFIFSNGCDRIKRLVEKDAIKISSTMKQLHGTIIQSLSGFYKILANGQEYVTKPRGNFRHQQMKPLVGDEVVFEYNEQAPETVGRLLEVAPRHNQFIRPAVANVDVAFVVMSLVEPDFSFALLDQYLIAVEERGIEPIILLSKMDLLRAQKGDEAERFVQSIRAAYAPTHYQILVIDLETASKDISQLVAEGIHIVMGQSGVGKSTLLNQLIPNVSLATSEISSALNRGKHTTREVTLYQLNEGLIADTPGFSALDVEAAKESLATLYPEMRDLSDKCRFRSCLHLEEPDCAVKLALEQQQIAPTRYQSYLQQIQKIEQRKPIYRRKK